MITCMQVARAKLEREVGNLNMRQRSINPFLNAARKFPDSISTALIPCPSLTVTELLSESHATDSAHSSAKTASYSRDSPNVFVGDPSGLIFRNDIRECRPLAHLFTSLNHAAPLRKEFHNAWLDGAQSILLPDDPISRYPLWSEHLLGDLETSTRKARGWAKASDRLHSTVGDAIDGNAPEMVADCFGSFNQIPWDAIVTGLGQAVSLSTKDLATFCLTTGSATRC